MSGPTTRESDKFMLRLPDGMRDRIKAAADANNRSMNAEIILALEQWLSSEPQSQQDAARMEVEAQRREVEAMLTVVRDEIHVTRSREEFLQRQMAEILRRLDELKQSQ